MQNIPRLILKADDTIQTRTARSVDPQLEASLRQVCEADEGVLACYLLDAYKPDKDESFLIVAVTVEAEPEDLDGFAQKVWEILQQFPKYVSRTYIMSSRPFRDKYAGSEFYFRQ